MVGLGSGLFFVWEWWRYVQYVCMDVCMYHPRRGFQSTDDRYGNGTGRHLSECESGIGGITGERRNIFRYAFSREAGL